MAWSPSPEVQVARDAAARLGILQSVSVQQVVILYVTRCRRVGYVSYGADAKLCADARKMADKLFAVGARHLVGGTP